MTKPTAADAAGQMHAPDEDGTQPAAPLDEAAPQSPDAGYQQEAAEEDTAAQSPPRWVGAIAGIVAAAAAVSAAEVSAALIDGAQSLITAIGTVVINAAPPALKDAAIAALGTADKPALIAGVLVVLAMVAALIGVLALRRWWLGALGVSALGAVGLAASLAAGASGVQAVVPAAAAIVVGIGSLLGLLITLRDVGGAGEGLRGRRAFLRTAAVTAAGAAAAFAGARWLQARNAAETAPLTTQLPQPATPLPPVPADATLDVEGITPFVTPNADFYRIDTALRVPTLSADDWTLRVVGMVDNPLELTYDELQRYEIVEADITMTCVSNEVGGNLVGTARWLGVRLSDVLADAGVQPGADQLVGRAFDGFTTGSPVAAVTDGRDALIAIGMNGEPLPREHGFPARLVTAGLYGYVSATKWLTEIELTTFDAFDAYWAQRRWSAKAPIKTQSRIDVPRPLSTVPAGRVAVAGVAWAQTRGISLVEVKVDDGDWQRARLAKAVGDDTWRQWVYEWDATPGRHELVVRATDGAGNLQTGARRPPRPDGATGRHNVVVMVSGD